MVAHSVFFFIFCLGWTVEGCRHQASYVQIEHVVECCVRFSRDIQQHEGNAVMNRKMGRCQNSKRNQLMRNSQNCKIRERSSVERHIRGSFVVAGHFLGATVQFCSCTTAKPSRETLQFRFFARTACIAMTARPLCRVYALKLRLLLLRRCKRSERCRQLPVASECTGMLKEQQRMKEQEFALLEVHLESLHSIGRHERVGRHGCLLCGQ